MRRRKLRAPSLLAGALAAASVLTGCSALVQTDIGEPCTTEPECDAAGLNGYSCLDGVCQATFCAADADCASAGLTANACTDGICQVIPSLSCVGQVSTPAPGSGTRTWRARYILATSEQPPPGMQVALCRASDIDCTDPIDPSLTVDANGGVSRDVPYEFEGYTIVTSSLTEDALINLPGPVVVDVPSNGVQPYKLLPKGTQAAYYQGLLELPGPDAGRTSVVTISLDCNAFPAPGTRIDSSKADEKVATLYLGAGDVPDLTLDATSASGSGNTVLLNHPTGLSTFSLTRASTGETISRRSVNIAVGKVNYLPLPPTPL